MVNHRVSYVKDITEYVQPYLSSQLSYTTKVEPFAGQRNCSLSAISRPWLLVRLLDHSFLSAHHRSTDCQLTVLEILP